MKYVLLTFLLPAFIACNSDKKKPQSQYPLTGQVEQMDPALAAIIDTGTKAEVIAEGFEWSEGPLWIGKQHMLLFSDVPKNTVYKWTEEKGKEVYLTPSGYTGTAPNQRKEPGSNGLTLDPQGRLVLCQHGDRQVAVMNAPLDTPAANFTALAAAYNGKRLSSPNDAVFSKTGELFFTDPPYGLPKQDDSDSLKEQPWNGVYKAKKDGTVLLLVDSIVRPNGIAFFPDGRLLVACSDPGKPNWYVFDVKGDSLVNGRIFYRAAGYEKNWRGLPDGFRINKQGIVFATGPGGIYIFNSEAKLLGKIWLKEASSNCALSTDEKTLYITNDMNVLRIKLK